MVAAVWTPVATRFGLFLLSLCVAALGVWQLHSVLQGPASLPMHTQTQGITAGPVDRLEQSVLRLQELADKLAAVLPQGDKVAVTLPQGDKLAVTLPPKRDCEGEAAKQVWDWEWHGNQKLLGQQLIDSEKKFSPSGRITGIPCARGYSGPGSVMICGGGDRMKSLHNYAPCYAKYIDELRRALEDSKDVYTQIVMAEIGILKGSGLAIWSDLLGCGADLHGFDLDTSNTVDNMGFLRGQGGFVKGNLKGLHTMNQTDDNTALVGSTVRSKLVFVIDDGWHSWDSVLHTFRSFESHLAKDFLYIIEDVNHGGNSVPFSQIQQEFGGVYNVEVCRFDQQFVAITPRPT